ncbi:methylation protein EvaC [Micromonospora phaseoli]|uniref:Methylation protein EvaC n=1 Tax=Micromonospora phaseoli TaxID=1144548 RepID=A0A1H7BVX0_9ACTN|nr:class I SAM-dependent methyltransferase [Micromonospora phaseoli]PZV92790.1 methylation protein EvaC [Micromonospora phaseoli]GIJ76553.1 SAM-dependent methyltransferase [Micromonospora phaseoli]SEJ81803.1 methylation protein EvaC [Micromonospora phaseoli]
MNGPELVSVAPTCRLCAGPVREWMDLGRQPASNAFPRPDETDAERFFRLAVGICAECTMVQQLEAMPTDHMFRADYPYRSSTSDGLRRHFEAVAGWLRDTELTDRADLVVEIGCNDGAMLGVLGASGVRHLGVDPSAGAARTAVARGAEVRVGFFDEVSAAAIRAERGPAKVVFSANTISHVADIGTVFRGVDRLLTSDGIFVFEDRYVADIVEYAYFDQIYDEHFYLFSVRAVDAMVARFGFELVDVERIPIHGGSLRFTVARPGARPRRASVGRMIDEEAQTAIGEYDTYLRFARQIERVGADLVALLTDLRDAGRRVVGYGATSKSATVTNFCGIGPDLVPFICDTTPEKQGRLSPGMHIPVRPHAAFADPYPDYALLFAWNHAEEIMAKERHFVAQGGRWILYVPHVHIV